MTSSHTLLKALWWIACVGFVCLWGVTSIYDYKLTGRVHNDAEALLARALEIEPEEKFHDVLIDDEPIAIKLKTLYVRTGMSGMSIIPSVLCVLFLALTLISKERRRRGGKIFSKS
ncbi:hypothetical protein MLD52_19165 [Puniceicoccaceae bacterium K14]|nr:hypothetical protein [Puniceicoccaceae bacterium K14]